MPYNLCFCCDFVAKHSKFNCGLKCPLYWQGGSCCGNEITTNDNEDSIGLFIQWTMSKKLGCYESAAKYAKKIANLPENLSI